MIWQFVLVVTNKRCIFAEQTRKMFTEERLKRAQRAKEEHKGFFGQWRAAYPSDLSDYVQRYLSMEPEIIFRENNDNFFLENSGIDSIEFITRMYYNSFNGHKYNFHIQKPPVKLIITSKNESWSYYVHTNYIERRVSQPQDPYYPKDFEKLQGVFGQKIKLSIKMEELLTDSIS